MDQTLYFGGQITPTFKKSAYIAYEDWGWSGGHVDEGSRCQVVMSAIWEQTRETGLDVYRRQSKGTARSSVSSLEWPNMYGLLTSATL